MSFNDGDFVKMDYTARRAADSAVVYTTKEDVAKKENIYSAETQYVPQLVVIGKNNTIKGVENALKGMAVGESKKLEIDPKDAFGDRDESRVNVMRLSDFREKDIDPQPGMQINLDGSIAIVKSVNSGRVVIDLNHPLAGEKLIYDVKVVEKLEAESDKVKALAAQYGLKPDSVTVTGGVAKLIFGEKVEKNTDYLVAKSALADTLLRYLGNLTKITFEEEYGRTDQKK